MSRMPNTARPMALYIRRKVKRPRSLPTRKPGKGSLPCLGWVAQGLRGCPMGLLPEAQSPQPGGLLDFSSGFPFANSQVTAFWVWWDSQEDPKKAVNAVWGKP